MEGKLPVLRARLGAARLALSQFAPGTAEHASTSRAQARAVIDLAVRCADSLTPECRAIVVEVASTVPWHGQDGVAVSQTLAGPEISFSSCRRQQQNYMTFILYLSVAVWERLMDPQVSLTSKENILFTILIQLGLRNPSEHTAKAVASFLLMLDRSHVDCMAMPTSEKQKYNSALKCDLKRRLRNAEKTMDYPIELPEDPARFSAQYPALWRNVFAEGEGPSAPKIDVRHWKMVDGSYRCRGGGAPVAAQSAGTGSNVPTLVTTGGPIEQFGGMMMQCMQHMQQQQQQMLEYLTKGCTSPGPASPTPRGLLGLLDRRLDSGDGRSRLALQDGSPGAHSPTETTALAVRVRDPPPSPPQALLHETLKAAGPSAGGVAPLAPPPGAGALALGVAAVATSAASAGVAIASPLAATAAAAEAAKPLAVEAGAAAMAPKAAPAPFMVPAAPLLAAKLETEPADSDDEPLTRLVPVGPAAPPPRRRSVAG